ncbi:IPTL-CTERM sorting domain-containing protein [Rudaea sp.]|uniref:IPTL-CTERM sorting domain-containing protein n=1 Tax=Rudaea sp. TaxID=2136325 RepID=UPI002ED5D7E6
MKHLVFGLVAILSLLSAPAVAQNLIVNGDFETPATPAGGYIDYPSGSTALTGWTVIGAANGISTVSSGVSVGCCTFPAQNGSAWLDLTGYGTNSNEGIQQTVATTAGTQYTLSFWVGNVHDGLPGLGLTSTAIVLINGVQAGSFTNTANAQTQSWQQFNVNFTATGASTTIAFVNGDPALDDNNGLDNITLVAATAPQPPPAPSVSAPTLSQWAALLLVCLLAWMGVAKARRARGRK